MPGHTINKLLTPPDFLQHTPVPHVEKSSHAYRKTSDHLHAVQSVIDYSVRAQRFLTHFFFFFQETYGNMPNFQNVQSVPRKLNLKKHGFEINSTDTKMTLPFQFTKNEPRTGVFCLYLTTAFCFGTVEMLMHWKTVLCCS